MSIGALETQIKKELKFFKEGIETRENHDIVEFNDWLNSIVSTLNLRLFTIKDQSENQLLINRLAKKINKCNVFLSNEKSTSNTRKSLNTKEESVLNAIKNNASSGEFLTICKYSFYKKIQDASNVNHSELHDIIMLLIKKGYLIINNTGFEVIENSSQEKEETSNPSIEYSNITKNQSIIKKENKKMSKVLTQEELSKHNLSSLFDFAKSKREMYSYTGNVSFLNDSTEYYYEYKKRGGKKVIELLENKLEEFGLLENNSTTNNTQEQQEQSQLITIFDDESNEYYTVAIQEEDINEEEEEQYSLKRELAILFELMKQRELFSILAHNLISKSIRRWNQERYLLKEEKEKVIDTIELFKRKLEKNEILSF